MTTQDLITESRAETLLRNSHILEHVSKLTAELSYKSDGEAVSYEDMYTKLAIEVDALQKLRLALDVAPGTESQYSVQLTMGMEQVADECERVFRHVVKFESKVRDAVGRLKRMHGEFCAWYTLALQHRMGPDGCNVRLSAVQAKQLADSEFSRLTSDLDITLDSLLNVIKLLKLEVKEHKKTQIDKYGMGKDQVNASWTSHMPTFNGGESIIRTDPGARLESQELDEEEIIEEQGFVPHADPAPEGTFFKTGTARPVHIVEEA